jgi:hypothetical protein
MQCARCRKRVSDGAPIWRVSIGYGLMYYPPAVQSWCAACAATLAGRRWHPEQPCEQCGRPVFFTASRRIPLHAVCGDACRSAVKLAQARTRRARTSRQRQATCMACGTLFSPRRTDALFCSSPCRQRAYRQRQHAEAA